MTDGIMVELTAVNEHNSVLKVPLEVPIDLAPLTINPVPDCFSCTCWLVEPSSLSARARIRIWVWSCAQRYIFFPQKVNPPWHHLGVCSKIPRRFIHYPRVYLNGMSTLARKWCSQRPRCCLMILPFAALLDSQYMHTIPFSFQALDWLIFFENKFGSILPLISMPFNASNLTA